MKYLYICPISAEFSSSGRTKKMEGGEYGEVPSSTWGLYSLTRIPRLLPMKHDLRPTMLITVIICGIR